MQWWCVAQGTPWEWTWTPYPGVWIFLGLLVAGRSWISRRAGVREGRAGAGQPARRRWFFGAGIAALWVALDWPVGALGAGYLASAHMVQFLLIALVAPPLLLLGLRPEVYERLSPPPVLRGALDRLVHPLTALLFFAVTMAWTHWPPVVDTWMSTQVGSFALDMVWLLGGTVFWWPVVSPRPARSWFGYPGKVGYLVVATIVNTGVFMYLTYAELPLYRIYELAPPVSLLSTRDDQVVAGLLMKMGGGLILWTAITVLFGRWYLESEREGDSLGPAESG